MTWDGRERRQQREDGREGRRPTDWHCGDHHTIQDNTKEHRAIVCNKISDIKINHEMDLKELKTMIEQKATTSDLKGIMRLIGVLITILIVVVGGAMAWLKSDLGVVTTSIQRLNVRVTESMNDRIATDMEQTRALETITGQLGTINWRLTEIESRHKSADGETKRP